MNDTAPKKQKLNILITNANSYLGTQLSKSLLDQNCIVYGIGSSSLPHQVLSNHDFTLLEIDLSQPLPSYLPKFDIVFDLSQLMDKKNSDLEIPKISAHTSNILNLVKNSNAQAFIFTKISVNSEYYDYLINHISNGAPIGDLKRKIKLFLVGDLYGPQMPLEDDNELAKLIVQSTQTEKVILENEGLKHIYPAFIKDVIFAINKIVFGEKKEKNTYLLVSEEAKTSLTVAYEIQNTARIVSGKEIGLFYAGPESKPFSESEVIVKSQDLDFNPKFHLNQGLKETFQYLLKNDLIKKNEKVTSKTNDFQVIDPHLIKDEEADNFKLKAKKQKNKRISTKFPKFTFKWHAKLVVLLLILLLIGSVSKTGLDIYLGTKNAKKASGNVLSGNFEKAEKQALSSSNSFNSAKNFTKILTFPLSFFLNNQVQSTINMLDAASSGAEAVSFFAKGADSYKKDLSIIANPEAKTEEFDLETPSANFKRAYTKAQKASNLIEISKERTFFKSKAEEALSEINKLSLASNSAYELTNLTNNLIGAGAQKNYLVLFQNNTELRPGGGFIGNFAQIEFDEGKLQNVSVEDIYTIDGQLKEEIEPPKELKEKLSVDNFYLRDSNWSTDFNLNAKTARDFFKKETGKDVDGVVAIDLNFIQDVLDKIGTLHLTDYNENITAQNLFEKGEYYSEVGFFPGSTQKRDFFGALTRTLISKIIEDLKSEDNISDSENSHALTALIDSISNSLAQKHILISFDQPSLASFVQTKGWDNPLPPLNYNPVDDSSGTRDFLALSEANLGANKVNRRIKRSISYDMTIGKDADLVATLKINYKNTSLADTWPEGKYVNFLRVYTPFASGLLEFKNGEEKDLELVETTGISSLTVFSTFVEVPINSEKEIIFKYRIPKNINLELLPTYSFYIQKQPGTDKDPFKFTFNLPGYLNTKSVNNDSQYEGMQNVSLETDLSVDQIFKIDLLKKTNN